MEIKKYTLTIPKTLLDRIRKECTKKDISINYYIVDIISKSI